MSSPVFSVILPGYNRAKILPKAIESVLSQLFKDWELIVIDDGSKDNTREVVTSYTDPRIRYVYQKNKERSAARNNGISNAKGEYICFLDSDDYYLENHMAVLYDEIKKSGFAKAFFYTGLMSEDHGKLKNVMMKSVPGEHPVNFAFANLLQCNAAAIHRELFKENLFDERFTVWEDMHLWLRILLKHPFIKINANTAVIAEHSDRSINGMFNKVNLKQIDNYMNCVHDFFDKHGKEIEPYISKKTYRDFVQEKLMLFAEISIHNRQFMETLKLFARIIKNSPSVILNMHFIKLVLLTGKRLFIKR